MSLVASRVLHIVASLGQVVILRLSILVKVDFEHHLDDRRMPFWMMCPRIPPQLMCWPTGAADAYQSGIFNGSCLMFIIRPGSVFGIML